MKEAVVTKIDDTTYRFTENGLGTDVYMYLLIGEEKVLLIDTGYGFTDVPTAIKRITDKELIVVNTHGHFDHVHGNHLYDAVYLPRKDEEAFKRHTSTDYLLPMMQMMAKFNHQEFGEEHKAVATAYPSHTILMEDNTVFDLGNRSVSVIATPGHTIGSVCLLDEKNKWLFSGDMACRFAVLLNFEESTDVLTYSNSMKMLKEMANRGDFVLQYPGHQITPFGLEIFDTYIEGCEKILNNEIDEETKNRGAFMHNGSAIMFQKIK